MVLSRALRNLLFASLLFLHADIRFLKCKSDCNQDTVIQFLSNQNSVTQFLSPFAVSHGQKQRIPTVD